jgi:hypothetical protein
MKTEAFGAYATRALCPGTRLLPVTGESDGNGGPSPMPRKSPSRGPPLRNNPKHHSIEEETGAGGRYPRLIRQ